MHLELAAGESFGLMGNFLQNSSLHRSDFCDIQPFATGIFHHSRSTKRESFADYDSLVYIDPVCGNSYRELATLAQTVTPTTARSRRGETPLSADGLTEMIGYRHVAYYKLLNGPALDDQLATQEDLMHVDSCRPLRKRVAAFFALAIALIITGFTVTSVRAQDTVTGAFEGFVKESVSKEPVAGAVVRIVNQDTGVPRAAITDNQGRFYQGVLNPGNYAITVTKPTFQTYTINLRLAPTRVNQVVPVPVFLISENTSTTTTTTTTTVTQPTTPTTSTMGNTVENDSDVGVISAAGDARRGGSYTGAQVQSLPLGATTLTRSFDELALLLPGIAPPPQSEGGGTGPGVGAGVGTSGQFSVNGLRSRANNFTVDGSDNNDEDIGVRRQGFFALVPQPVESIQEFTVISQLAPAQYGRNMGAQVNAVSRSGGNRFHGALFGMYNNSALNSPNFFDNTGPNRTIPLTGTTPGGQVRNIFLDDRQLFVTNNAGGEDPFALGQGGGVIGGPIVPNKLFFFASAERQVLTSSKESHFAVPTVAQRGAFGTGAFGIAANPFTGAGGVDDFPTTVSGDAIFSFFPFPNDPTGVYGANTFTDRLPASARGTVASGKIDYNGFSVFGKPSSFTGRYNFTSDWRDIPVTGGGLFSRLRPHVQTQNFSTFLNSDLSGTNSTRPLYNQLRLSYGRTTLDFEEGRDSSHLLPVQRQFNNPADARFLMNTRFIANNTLPSNPNCLPNTACYVTFDPDGTEVGPLGGPTLGSLGPIGQIKIAGFSPVGVDVFNFPQARVNNTYQVADTVTWRTGSHNFSFGTDLRRTELISDLPRNARPLVTFNGARRVVLDAMRNLVRFASPAMGDGPIQYIRPEDYAAAGAASGFFQSLVLPGRDSHINLRYYQIDFFAQDEWRVKPNLTLSAGLRYEYNTAPRDTANRIESTFRAPLPNLVSGLANFIDGRTKIFDAQKTNFAPRIGLAYSPRPRTVIRGGYGLYYDQILGAVVSQSRNVFPTFTTINFGGGPFNVFGTGTDQGFNLFNPLGALINGLSLIQPGTLNTLNPAVSQNQLLTTVFNFFPSDGTGRPFGATLPTRRLKTPMAHEYSVSVEHEFNKEFVISGGYVGTLGRNLLRFTTPNLGANFLTLTDIFNPNTGFFGGPVFSGITVDPGAVTPAGTFSANRGRPLTSIGPINQFESTATSRYDALQIQARGRLGSRFQYQANYTFAKAEDDVSDVFDLAGASALPQNSRTFAGERGPANFDVRHRFAYDFSYQLPSYSDRGRAWRWVLGGLQITSTGRFQTGQPFTVNSIFDVNLDGNLTDRLNSTNGIVQTGNDAQPLQFTGNALSLLAAPATDGSVGRNTFRAGKIMELDLSFAKAFSIGDVPGFRFRMDIFNLTNRANFGIPVRFLEAPGFGRATDTVTPGRRVQFALKYEF